MFTIFSLILAAVIILGLMGAVVAYCDLWDYLLFGHTAIEGLVSLLGMVLTALAESVSSS